MEQMKGHHWLMCCAHNDSTSLWVSFIRLHGLIPHPWMDGRQERLTEALSYFPPCLSLRVSHFSSYPWSLKFSLMHVRRFIFLHKCLNSGFPFTFFSQVSALTKLLGPHCWLPLKSFIPVFIRAGSCSNVRSQKVFHLWSKYICMQNKNMGFWF